MHLSIIIINWNSCHYVKECLESVYSEPPTCEFEILVLDSGSFDGCGELIESEFPQARFFQSEENLGFARANNRAVKEAKGDLLLFLNPDTVVRPGALSEMCTVLGDDSKVGAVGARLLNTDGSVQTSCVMAYPTIVNQVLGSNLMIKLFGRTRIWGTDPLYHEGPGIPEAQALSGAAILTRRALFDSVGGFNESYFMYSEDVDLCYQIRKAGWKVCHAPDAEIVHHGGGSSDQQSSRFASVLKVEAIRRFLKQHRSATYARWFKVLLGFAALGRVVFLLPFYLVTRCLLRRKKGRVLHGFTRWIFILRWAMGLEAWSESDRPVLSSV